MGIFYSLNFGRIRRIIGNSGTCRTLLTVRRKRNRGIVTLSRTNHFFLINVYLSKGRLPHRSFISKLVRQNGSRVPREGYTRRVAKVINSMRNMSNFKAADRRPGPLSHLANNRVLPRNSGLKNRGPSNAVNKVTRRWYHDLLLNQTCF